MSYTNIFNTQCIEDLRPVAKELAALSETHNIFIFKGHMGVGKTTLIKEMCIALGVEKDEVNSPSFAIVNEYLSPIKGPIFHFDFYRIKSEEEAYDIGYEDYFFSGKTCLIEWPEMIENLVPENKVIVTLNVDDAEQRTIKIYT